ncbi:unnamed protein product [Tilletia controversa]|nr:unnamed protein product [Tilletia controversa]
MPAQVRRVLDAEIGARVDAALEGRLDVEQLVAEALLPYAQVVRAFHSAVVTRTGERADFPQRSSDGSVYFKINEDTLQDRFASAAETEDQHRSELQALERRVATLERLMVQQSTRSAGYSKHQPPKLSPSRRPDAAGDHSGEVGVSYNNDIDLTLALSKVKKDLARLAGLDLSHFASTKIWHLYFSADAQLPYHPPSFRPEALDLMMPSDPIHPNRPRRYRQLRINWNVGANERPNKAWFDPFIEFICQNASEYGLPDWITVETFRSKCFVPLYERMRSKHMAYDDGTLERSERERNTDSRRRERRRRKRDRRMRAAGVSTSKKPTPEDPDHESAFVLSMMSEDYTDEEDTESQSRQKQKMDLKGKRKAPQDTKPFLRDAMEFRSTACTDYLHAMDGLAPPSIRSRDSGIVRSLKPGQMLMGPLARWMLDADWYAEHMC